MRPTPEPEPGTLDSGQHPIACLERTRSHVLNVLVVVGVSIAISGWLLRNRALTWQPRPAKTLNDSLYAVLMALAATTYISRRMLTARAARVAPERFERLFYWAHVAPALVSSLAVPLGFAYGWLVRPHIDAIIPFWAVPFVLGFLALPRRSEWFDRGDSSPPREPASK
jgi:hypothetical protein